MTHHQHTWEPSDNPTGFACTDCDATAHQCSACPRPIETLERTCAPCVSRARNDLREIRDLYRQLPDVIAAVAGLHAIRYDRRGSSQRRAADTTLIGGTAFVLAGPGNSPDRGLQLGASETTETIAHLSAAEQYDPPSVLGALTGWEDAWRIERGEHAATRTTLTATVDYLLKHVEWTAQSSGRWYEYRADIRSLLGRLRGVTGTSTPPEKTGVPCPRCSGAVSRHWTDQGLSDIRRCDGCGREWATEAHFMLAIKQAHQDLPSTHPNLLVTLDDASRILKPLGVRPNFLSVLAHRDRQERTQHAQGDNPRRPRRLPPEHGRDVRGAALYRLDDLVRTVTRPEHQGSVEGSPT